MPGGIVKNPKDRVVQSIPERDDIAEGWSVWNNGQGVVVLDASKDYPAPGQGDPTVETPGSVAYYKWVDDHFVKIAEGESLDLMFSYIGASPSTISVGGIPANTVLTGRSFSSLFEQMLVVYLQPAFTAFAITGQNQTVEIGTTLAAGNKAFTWGASNAGNIKPNSIIIRDQSALADLVSALANDGNELVNIANPILLNAEGATQIYRILAENTQNVQFLRDFVITADYLRFFGSPGAAPNNSATIRALAGNTFGNAFTINMPQGNLISAFAYEATRPDIVDSSVKYVEGFNSNVGNTFVKSLVDVADAGGTLRQYKLYVQTLGAPYPNAATYNVTIP